MIKRTYIQIPGPTNIPERILEKLSKPMINHRGSEFMELVQECRDGMKRILKTKNEVLFFPSSGSGALESSIVNLFSKDDLILVNSHGVFSERVCKISEQYGLKVIRASVEWGKTITKDTLESAVGTIDKSLVKGVFITQNETTTGVETDVKDISVYVRENYPNALILVDAVSSLASCELRMDEWNLDVVVGASQKGLMLPPGMGIVALSSKAMGRLDESDIPKWYWDYKAALKAIKDNQFPYTPPTGIFYGLSESIKILEEEGIENVWKRHGVISDLVRESVKELGLKLLADDDAKSSTVTAILLPEKISFKELSEYVNENFGVVLGGGLDKLKGKIFRIGHMGNIGELDIYAIMGAVEMSLINLGYDVKPGATAKRIISTLNKKIGVKNKPLWERK